MKRILLTCMVIISTITASNAQLCSFTLGENWTNQTTCSPNTASVGGMVNLAPPPGGNGICPGSSVTVHLEKKNGTAWVLSQSYVVNTGSGSAPYGFTGITAGIYRIVGYPSPGFNCSGCSNFTTLVKPQQTVTIYDPVVAGFKFNSTPASTTTPYNGYGYGCNGQPLILNHTSAGSQTNSFQWKLYYYECNSTGTVTYGTAQGIPTWQSTAIASSYDLKTQLGGMMGLASSAGKYFLVTLEIKNSCSGTSSIKQGIVFVQSTPSNPTGVVKFNSGTGLPAGGQTASHSISSPNVGGCHSSGFKLASTTGTILFYSAKIDEVNCTTGALIQNIVDPGPYIRLADESVYEQIGINFVTSPTGYFGSNCAAVQNKCYKLTVTFGNECGNTTSEWTYFKINGSYKTDETYTDLDNIQTVEAGSMIIQLAPNPATNIINISIDAQENQQSSIKIYDLAGREVMDVAENFPLLKGENQFNLNITNLNAGTYVAQVISADGYRSSLKFIKNN